MLGTLLLLVASGIVGLGFAVVLAVLLAFSPTPQAGLLERVPFVAAAGGVTVVAILAVVSRRATRRTRDARARLRRFAVANGFEYAARIPDPVHPGAIFNVGTDRVATDVVRVPGARPVEMGHLRSVSGPSRAPTVHQWWYLSITLERPLPHLVLDARDNDDIVLGSGLPVELARAQRLSLEGDFDRHFTLYCPTGYEADALYFFTPDIMARFIDRTAQFDVEVVDDRLVLSGRRDVTWSAEPATWEWLLATIDALDAKLDRWERWRDDRHPDRPAAAAAGVEPPPVAPHGRRLRTRIPLLAVLPLAVMVGIWFVVPFLG